MKLFVQRLCIIFVINGLSFFMTHGQAESQELVKKHSNRLAREKSPYLLQHADNPVDWYPWGPEAFAKALLENKLIFLSMSLYRISQETPGEKLSEPSLTQAYRELAARFDERNGGFGTSPKFPSPHVLLFLMRYWNRTNSQKLETIRVKLFTHREKRIHPHKDDKILTDWNGLMIAAFAKAARVFNEPAYTLAAKRAIDFILKNMRAPGGRLFHRFRDGQAALPSHVDDYAFFIWGLLEFYETTFETSYLETALALNRDLLAHFWDDKNGGFYFTADDGENLLIRQKEIYDGAIPSGNSVAMLNMLRLSRITANSDLEKKASKIEKAFSGHVAQSLSAHAQLMSAVDFGIGPSYEVVIAGKTDAQDTKEMLRAIRKKFIPNKVVILRPSDHKSPPITRLAEFTFNQTSIDGKATAYVCRNYQCNLPTTDVQKMLELLKEK